MGVIEGLRGLRSFTVMGWLKPESLQVGSGGNRILFCLKENRSGIDLVCHSDGRLRLAVNEWPDSVRNDSSPGKLQWANGLALPSATMRQRPATT
jgi:hypothetical protein